MLPYEQTMEAAGKMKNAALAVLMELNHRRFKTHDNVVVLANSALSAVKISSKAKRHALRQLEVAGMVRVEWRGERKSPCVTILMAKSGPWRDQGLVPCRDQIFSNLVPS